MKKSLLLLISFTLLLSGSFTLVTADEAGDKLQQIAELEKKVAALKDQAQTLSGQIVVYDSQIRLAALKIEQTEDQVASLSAKIDILESKLQERSRLLERQIRETYKKGPEDPFVLLFSSTGFSDIVSRFKYLQIIQANNRKFLYETQKVQANYAQQKDLVEESHKKLTVQKDTLASLRAERSNLLRQTQNSEAIYQKQLEQARLELEAIQRALISSVREGPVNAGDPIALVGNSGYPNCSTGKHLHFEVRRGDSWVNAETYLKNMTDSQGVNIGSGDWDWPLRGSVKITQRYGQTPWSYRYRYSGGIHTGIDMTSSDDVIYAPRGGTLYSSSQQCGSSTLKLKYIDHGDGLKTFYLHVK